MHSVGFGRLSVSIDGELEQTLLNATVRAHLKIFLAELEQRGSTGFVHLLTLSPEKRGVPPPSAQGHGQAMASEKGVGEASNRSVRESIRAHVLGVQKGPKPWPNLQNRREVTRPRFVRFA
jgi:hypothetical protein